MSTRDTYLADNALALAVTFALDKLEPFEAVLFLRDMRKGDGKAWPEFPVWADDMARKHVEGVRQ